MEPDDVVKRYTPKHSKFVISLLPQDRHLVLIEGSAKALEFLGHILLAQASSKKDCHFSLDPKGAGSAWFARGATKGLYVHRLPCRSGRIAHRKRTRAKKER